MFKAGAKTLTVALIACLGLATLSAPAQAENENREHPSTWATQSPEPRETEDLDGERDDDSIWVKPVAYAHGRADGSANNRSHSLSYAERIPHSASGTSYTNSNSAANSERDANTIANSGCYSNANPGTTANSFGPSTISKCRLQP